MTNTTTNTNGTARARVASTAYTLADCTLDDRVNAVSSAIYYSAACRGASEEDMQDAIRDLTMLAAESEVAANECWVAGDTQGADVQYRCERVASHAAEIVESTLRWTE